MNHTLHFLRPEWFWAFIPLFVIALLLLRQKPISHIWQTTCDKHLLPHLITFQGRSTRRRAQLYLLTATSFMILALTGPSLKALPTPTYAVVHPRLILLDLSNTMLQKDLKPNRLTRAKFKLHDVFQHQHKGQFGLMVYTGEPFVVSPLTSDAQTIDALVDQLNPDIMPVGGINLAEALKAGAELIQQSGYSYGDILVLTGTPPAQPAIEMAEKLSRQHIRISVLALTASKTSRALFTPLTKAGHGENIAFTNKDTDLKQWLAQKPFEDDFEENENYAIPTWRDDGRWLLIPAFLCLMPAFRRFWLLRITP